MKQPNIKQVSNNKEKGNTYKRIIEKYNVAIEAGYYGEAELIVYAFMEDRLRAMLYHLGAINRRTNKNINDDAIQIIGKKKCINDISAKREVIIELMRIENLEKINMVTMLSTIANKGKYVKRNELKSLLKKVEEWCSYRNELVHGLFNKDIEDLHSGLATHVNQGYKMAREIDCYVSKIKSI